MFKKKSFFMNIDQTLSIWALCKSSFQPNSINRQKKFKLAMGKVQIYDRHKKNTFSDTAQYFHSKHLKKLPKRHEKHFLPRTGALGPNKYFPEFIVSGSFMST